MQQLMPVFDFIKIQILLTTLIFMDFFISPILAIPGDVWVARSEHWGGSERGLLKTAMLSKAKLSYINCGIDQFFSFSVFRSRSTIRRRRNREMEISTNFLADIYCCRAGLFIAGAAIWGW
jgi:hypothetical protein